MRVRREGSRTGRGELGEHRPRSIEEIDSRRNGVSPIFSGPKGMDGVAASKNWKAQGPSWFHRSGTSIYRKKIDTQKVYITDQATKC